VPILRRSSGGGTVLLGPGCLCYSLVLAYDRSSALREIRSSYAYILERVREALSDLLRGITCAGTSDLAANGRKFSGNAQQRKRHFLLHHGTLLYNFDFEQIGRFLRMPPRQPDYRAGRGHAAFLVNVPVSAAELQRRLRAIWQASRELRVWPERLVYQLAHAKYTGDEWIRRR
jgi:lipoate-protein ligase A